jgi:hypothetical protein
MWKHITMDFFDVTKVILGGGGGGCFKQILLNPNAFE